MKILPLKGMHDLGPPQVSLWQQVEQVARRVFENAGFLEVRTPILEEKALFVRGLGTATDVVAKEMYEIIDSSGKAIALRPEGTASVVRAYIDHFQGASSYRRFYYIGPMFRHERPQKGRFRQFHQIGVELFESDHPYTDAEVISLANSVFQTLGVYDVRLLINSLGCRECRPQFRQVLLEFLSQLPHPLCEDCQNRIDKNPLRVLDCKNPSCQRLLENAPSGLDTLCEKCLNHFEGVQKGLKGFSIPYQVHPRMVRGLDYYEKTAFEFVSDRLGAQSAVAGGGRYNGLVQELGGADVPGIGFAMGLERLVSLLPEPSLSLKPLTLVLACLGETAQKEGLGLLDRLRKAGLKALLPFESPSLKSMMRQADRLDADYVLILGDVEMEKGIIQVKDMKTHVAQKEIPLESVVLYFTSLLNQKSPSVA